MNKLEVCELKPGDVVLFLPEDNSCIGWAITTLSDSPVSHASVYCADGIIAHAAGSGVVYSALKDVMEENRNAYVCRHKNPKLDMSIVTKQAKICVERGDNYSFGNLFLAGMLLINTKVNKNYIVQRATALLLKGIAAKIVQQYNKVKYKGKTPVHCSQFVANCFEDAGADYKLSFKACDKVLSNMEEISLLDYAISAKAGDIDINPEIPVDADIGSIESICKLVQRFIQARDIVSNEIDTEQSGITVELYDAVNEFASVFYSAVNETDLDVAANVDVLSILKAHTNAFVSPGDLLLHCEDLEEIGIV